MGWECFFHNAQQNKLISSSFFLSDLSGTFYRNSSKQYKYSIQLVKQRNHCAEEKRPTILGKILVTNSLISTIACFLTAIAEV